MLATTEAYSCFSHAQELGRMRRCMLSVACCPAHCLLHEVCCVAFCTLHVGTADGFSYAENSENVTKYTNELAKISEELEHIKSQVVHVGLRQANDKGCRFALLLVTPTFSW